MGLAKPPQSSLPILKDKGPDSLMTATPLLPGAVAGAIIVSGFIFLQLRLGYFSVIPPLLQESDQHINQPI